MAHSVTVGKTAQIITHARFDRPQVEQTPRWGRLPNSVIKFWKAGGDIRMMRYFAQERQQEIAAEVLRASGAVKCFQKFLSQAQYELAALKQKNHHN